MSPDAHARFERLVGVDVDAALAEAAAIGAEARATGRRVVAVSACLLGERVRPDGGHKHAPEALAALEDDPLVVVLPVCPEVLARLGVPRPTVQFAEGDGQSLLRGEGRIVDAHGRDRTDAMVAGADLAERLCVAAGAEAALLKERSPSCGTRRIHGPDGVQKGSGVFAARLARRGVALGSEVEPLATAGDVDRPHGRIG